METKKTVLARQRKATYPSEKKESRHRPWIFFLVLTCLSAGSPQIELVNFCFLTSSWLVFNCMSLLYNISLLTLQKTHHLLPFTWYVSGMNICFHSLRTCVHSLWTSSFLLSFLITMRALAWLFRDCLLYLFIQFQFSMSHSII